MHTIVCICSANICRSPMAHAIFASEAARRGLKVNILSAGVWDFAGELAATEAQRVCERRMTPMPKLVAMHVGSLDLSNVTRIFVMEHAHVSALVGESGVARERIALLGEFDPEQRGPEIDDPIGKDDSAFERCYQRLRDCIVHYLDTTQDL